MQEDGGKPLTQFPGVFAKTGFFIGLAYRIPDFEKYLNKEPVQNSHVLKGLSAERASFRIRVSPILDISVMCQAADTDGYYKNTKAFQ